jgi:alkyldihydroxyacetonephosphate synthase
MAPTITMSSAAMAAIVPRLIGSAPVGSAQTTVHGTLSAEMRRDEGNTVAAQRSPWGWGWAEQHVDAAELAGLGQLVAARFPDAELRAHDAVPLTDVSLPAPRLQAPAALASICRTDLEWRCLHGHGQSFTDVVRAFRGEYPGAPDVVAEPRDAVEVAAVLDWCAEAGAVCVPFGGGTSVVGGVTLAGSDRPVVVLSLRAMDRVLDVDRASRAARIQAGASGPVLEDQLRDEGLTMRFFPQSFEHSTLGGWIATRAGGHYATRLTHVDDLVEQVTAVTPSGVWASRRLPGSGAGPSPDRLLLGSEGILGVVTEAWVRLQDRPRHRARAAVRFGSFTSGTMAVRSVVQAGLAPANCRLVDPVEAALNGVGDGSAAVLLLAFESAQLSVHAQIDAALGICRDAGGAVTRDDEPVESAGEQWRSSFLRAPYLRDALIRLGVIAETFETAVTWDRFAELHNAVADAVGLALAEVCGDGVVTCRITHAYPDGAAPYFTVIAPGRRGSEDAQWAEIKTAASEAILAAGGTITHHHAVGRDHRPWYDRQRPGPFAAALAAAKRELDPAGVLNPGVLLPPAPA